MSLICKPEPKNIHRGAYVGSVSARASEYSWFNEGQDFSGGFHQSQNRCGAAKEVEPAVVGGDLLIGSGATTEKVTQLVVGPGRIRQPIVGS
jgi:hypothetical protein